MAFSPDHIVGDNLMTDHLHPTLTGYMLMGKTFFDEMKRLNFMPKSIPKNISDRIQDSLTISNFHFSKLDSVIGNYRVRLLKNDWPFKNKNEKLPDHEVLMPKDHIDSVAAKFLIENSNWEEAHRKLAEWYINKNDIYSFLDLMNVLIAQYPIIYGYYDYIANELLNRYMYDEAYIYLKKRFDEQPNAFSAKWLGIIDLSKNKFESAKKYLMQCLKYDKKDSQVYYNLSGCYVSEGNYKLALETNTKALELNPNYLEAKNLQTQLTNAVKTEELAKDD